MDFQPTPAALYLRASTEHQKYSTSNQAEALRQYAIYNHHHITAVYEDDGYSGLDLRGRPALRRLLQDVLDPARGFETLLVYDISRWGRFQDPDESAYYEFLCRRAGIDVVYCAEPFLHGQTDAMAAVLKSIKRAMAAEYSRELSRKTFVGQRRVIAEGFAVGGPHNFGLRRLLVDAHGRSKHILNRGERKSVHTDRVVMVPGPAAEIAVINRIFRMCAVQRFSEKRIAALLNQEGIPSPGGKRWCGNTVTRILTNEKYMGTNVYGRTRGHLKERRVDTPASEWVRKEGAFAGIVTPSLFKRANRNLRQIQPKRTDDQLLDALRKLLAQKGRLSNRLIYAAPNVASPETYACRFRGIGNAYRLIGYEPPPRKPPMRAEVNRDALLDDLRRLLALRGKLSRRLLQTEAGFSGPHVYRWHFGGLKQAYALIGYRRESVVPTPP